MVLCVALHVKALFYPQSLWFYLGVEQESVQLKFEACYLHLLCSGWHSSLPEQFAQPYTVSVKRCRQIIFT